MVQISLLAHKFRGEDKKKGFRCKILRSVFAFNVFFVLERNFTHAWGAQAVFWEGTGPKIHSSSTGSVTFFRGTTLAWGALFSLGGAQRVIWGSTAPKCPLVAPACIQCIICIRVTSRTGLFGSGSGLKLTKISDLNRA